MSVLEGTICGSENARGVVCRLGPGHASRCRKRLSPAQRDALRRLHDSLEAGRCWYHDLGAQVSDALLAMGLVREHERTRCLSRSCRPHPGYLVLTPAGLDLVREDLVREIE
jgi:hypothetical protein